QLHQRADRRVPGWHGSEAARLVMAANSLFRRVVKRALRPFLGDSAYSVAQAVAKAWDIRSGGWTEPELDVIPYAVQAGDLTLDIGANYGLYSYHLARAVGPSGRVIAFEPIPFNIRTFRMVSSLLRLKNVDLRPEGCGEKDSEMVFRIPVAETGAL